MKKSKKIRAMARPNINRRNFLRIERLEDRMVLTGFAPVAANDSYHLVPDQTLEISAPGILANDTDAEGDALTAALFSGPAHGNLTLDPAGSFQYMPEAGFAGIDSFMYMAADDTGHSLLAAVTLRVGNGSAPVSQDDSFTVNEDQVLTVPAAAGVLHNDSDPDSDALTAALVTGPTNGTVSLADDGSFVYTPAVNFHGSDSFVYQANDGTGSGNLATVSITVSSINDTPIANNDAFSVDEDTSLVTSGPGVLGNDSDADGDTLTATMLNDPLHGSLDLASDGSFTYAPAANFHGVDGFSYLVSDGISSSNVATVTLEVNSVNDSPIATNDEYTTDEDSPMTIDAAAGVIGNDTDADGDTLVASLVSGPTHGTLTLKADGSFIYTPEANFNGVDGFSYVVNDGTADSDVASVTLNVNSVNDSPVATNDEYTTDEDTPLTVDVTGGVIGNDTDVDGDSLVASLVTGPTHGTLTLNADGSFVYTPEANFNGVDGFSYVVNDGTTDSDVASVTFNVNAINDSPIATNDEYTTDEDTPLSIDAATGLLANDSDPDSTALTVSLVSEPVHGSVVMNEDGSFSYTPNADFNGVDGFSYTVSDGSLESDVATVTINVSAVADAPLAQDDTFTTDEDIPLVVDLAGSVLTNDSDVDGDSLTAALVTGPAHGSLALNGDGSFSYTPEANFTGSDSFIYTANDSSLASNEATVTIMVNPTNDAPLAVADEYTLDEDSTLHVDVAGVLTNDSDPDGDILSAVLVSGPASGTLSLNADGSFGYAPAANFHGADSFVYKANDGLADSNEVTVSINVQGVNDAPLAEADSYTTDEDTPLTIDAPGILANDSDVDGDPLTSILVNGPTHGTLSLAADGSLTYSPEANFNGTDSFTYKASDGSLESGETTVTITVNPVTDAPLSHNDAYSTGEDLALTTSAVMGVLANDFDPQDIPLTAELVSGPANGTLTLNADGSFTYLANANYYGTDSFTYVANNGVEAGSVMTANIVVQPLNDAPLAVNDDFTTDASGSLNASASTGVLVNDSDIDGDPLSATLLWGPQHGSLTLNSDGSFSYLAASGYQGTDSFKYQLNDGLANSNVAIGTLHVGGSGGGENSAPQSNDDAFAVDAGSTLTIGAPGVLQNDSDADNDPLTVAVVNGTAHGTLAIGSDGSFNYTPETGFVGTDSFTYTASDGTATGNVATATIDVQDPNQNHNPVASDDSYVATAETKLSVSAGNGVLANDTDADGNPLTAQLVGGASYGTVTLNPDGSFDYQPQLGFTGADTFSYQAADGIGLSNVATVTINVGSAANHRPVAVNDHFTTTVDQPLSIAAPGLLGNDSDPNGNPLTAELFGGAQHGSISLNADGSYVYTPDAGFQGRDSFIYRTFDGEVHSTLAAVTIYVNSASPAKTVAPATPDQRVSTHEGPIACFLGAAIGRVMKHLELERHGLHDDLLHSLAADQLRPFSNPWDA